MSAAVHSVPSATSNDEAEVRELLRRLYAAWGDADAYAGFFTPDADYVAFDGSHAKGRKAIAEMHRPLFERFLKNTRLVSMSETVRFPTPDVALVHGKGAVVSARQQQPAKSRLSVQTLVAVKQADGWLFTAFQNTRYRPFAETLLGKILTRLGRAPSGE